MDFEKIFREELGWDILPLSENYDPDSYAKFLMKDVSNPDGVVYATSSEICIEQEV